MARYSKKSQYKQVEDRVIYVLGFPGLKDFYIGHCRKDLLKDVYRDHLRGERYKTKNAVAECKAQGLRPCLHVLEEVRETKVDAYHHVIAWSKIFAERGYMGLDNGNVVCYMEDMLEHTLSVYEQHKTVDLGELLRCETCVVAMYGRRLCPSYIENEST